MKNSKHTEARHRAEFADFAKDYFRRTSIDGKKLADLCGAISIAGAAALRRGDVCLFGLNPGGAPAQDSRTIEEMTGALSAPAANGVNEYWDGKHAARGASGRSPYRARVRHLLCVLSGCGCGKQLDDGGKCGGRTLYADNLIFIRTPNKKQLEQNFGNIQGLAEKCWPVNEKVINDVVKPRLIIALSVDCYDFLRKKGRAAAEEEKGEEPDKKKCLACQVRFGYGEVNLVYVPHLSYYPLNKRAVVMKWIKEKLPQSG